MNDDFVSYVLMDDADGLDIVPRVRGVVVCARLRNESVPEVSNAVGTS